jgi:hypothetical protein
MVTIDTARKELQELAQWVTLMPATPSDAARVRGAGMGTGGFGPKRSESPAPGNVDRWIDTWFDNGPLGIHTQCGVWQALGHWADEIRGMRDALVGPDPHAGTIAYIADHIQWAADHMPADQWAFMAADIHGVHDRVQHLVHPDRLHEGTCPTCGARIEWILGDHGKINIPICPNHHRIDNLTGATLRRLRAADETDAPAYATMAEVQVLFPKLKPGTLRKWVFEGKVKKEGSRYQINQITTRYASMQRTA